MAKIITLKSMLAVAGVVATLGATAAQAQAVPNTPQIKFDPIGEHPAPPAGLNASCTKQPDSGYQASTTCPVIYYGSTKTWIYSYDDNRVSFALVTYGANGAVLRNVEYPGARYVFDAFSDDHGQKITIIGQAKGSVMVNWSDLPH
ncbi:hypothetical protein [Caulobacter soli]|uniref:hypothetical protein n=1 Tax=Caulobacter soli TaxID=2708539 RepID=UPI0013EDDCC4|nr:hypothetical protein [Caulobacter soli]